MPLYKKIIRKLISKNISISIAESCTGGQLSKYFTDQNGVSKIFQMGLITYSNKSKSVILKINSKVIQNYGAVSEQVASLMVNNLNKISGSKLCISTTGIAGPLGGSKNKPVGLIYIGINFDNKTYIFKKNFIGTRSKIQKQTVFACLEEIDKLI